MSNRSSCALLPSDRHCRVAAAVLFVAALLSTPGSARAADKACLLEGSFKFAGKVTEIKDCVQNAGVQPNEFVETCKGIASIGAAMGSPPKISYMSACPASPQGVCEGMWGRPLHSYYYKRDAKDLADTKSSCLAQGGKWRG